MTNWKSLAAGSCIAALLAGMAACSGSGGSSGGDGPDDEPPPITVGSADAESWAAGLRWLEVVRGSDRFDECYGDPVAEPFRCVRGARSGSALGNAVHDWMEQELAAIPELEFHQRQVFDYAVFKPREYSLTVGSGDQRFSPAVFPWYYLGTTPDAGVQGELVAYDPLLPRDYTGKIVMFDFDLYFNAGTSDALAILQELETAGAAGAVASGRGPRDQILAQTLDSTLGMQELPTLVVSQQDSDSLRSHVGEVATLVLTGDYETRPSKNGADGRDVPVPGLNTMAYLPGADPDNVLVIGTPLNGILLSGGERAPGIGILVYLARYFAQQAREQGPLPYSIYFVATGGHEVYGYGLGRFLACLPRERMVAYVHLGAGLVYQGYLQVGPLFVRYPGMHQTRNLTVSENSVLRAITDDTFGDPALQPMFALPPESFNPGEAVLAYNAGIPTVSISGTNPYFHTAADDETQIYRPGLGPMAVAYRDTVSRLLQTDAAALRAANGPPVEDPRVFTCPSSLEALR